EPAVHVPALQVTPVSHVVPPQHGSPMPPHAQRVSSPHARFAPHVVPSQHGSSSAPHTHVFDVASHARFAAHTVPQHASSFSPHPPVLPTHVPPSPSPAPGE